jgi:hypothetical protein
MKSNLHTINYLTLAFGLVATLLSACKKDTNSTTPANEEEIITTVALAVQDSGVAPAVIRTFYWKDLDGPGGTAPSQQDTIQLNATQTGLVTLTLSDESVSPTAVISTEIEAEKNVHQFFFTPMGSNLSLAYNPADYDNNTPPKPLGLKTFWRTKGAGEGTVRLVLKHQPGLKAGINNTVGDATLGNSDLDITLPYRVR